MAGEYFPMFRDYNIAVEKWLREVVRIPRVDQTFANVVKITRRGTTNGGTNQLEVTIDSNTFEIKGRTYYKFKQGQNVELLNTPLNNGYYMIKAVVGNILIFDPDYKILLAEQPDAAGVIQQRVNVFYADMEKAISMIANPLRNGQHDCPGVAYYITNSQYNVEKSRPRENYYIKRVKDNIGNTTGVNTVPPLQEYQLNYTINLWARYRQELDMMQYQVLSEFSPQKFFWIPGAIYDPVKSRGKEHQGQWAHSIMESFQDVSELEPGDAQFRSLRFEIGFSVTNAYIPLPYEKDSPYIGSLQIETTTKEEKPFL